MITGFELETATLNEKELRVAESLARYFQTQCVGKQMAITSFEIEQWGGIECMVVTGARLRKIVNYIRRKKLVKNLIASSKGYYIATDVEEIKAYKKSLFERANAILDVMHSFD